MIATAGDTALIVVAAVWGVLVLFLCFVLRDTSRVLESTKLTIDAMREETVPLLREVKSSIERTNREIDRLDVVLESAGLVEEAASGPIVKFISLGAGLRKGFAKASKSSKKRKP
jgi:hypothetical protein